ncbi:helix-turn-helix transcriptional regulator [Methylophaga sp.]|uniref:response regulator transcription factor n=1 Tax=Methylophaga sp. TaxID=2024840 RepID=UPI003451CD0B
MKKLRVEIVRLGPLTKTEAKVLRYLCEGYTRNEIAFTKLTRSPSTINRHVESIALKLEASCQAEIVSTAYAAGLVVSEFRDPQAPLLMRLMLVLLMFNVTSGHVDMRGPRSPRPQTTYRASAKLSRTSRQYP